jgi:hypothetical protein
LFANGSGTAGTDDTQWGRLLCERDGGMQGLGWSTMGQNPTDADGTKVWRAGSGKGSWDEGFADTTVDRVQLPVDTNVGRAWSDKSSREEEIADTTGGWGLRPIGTKVGQA